VPLRVVSSSVARGGVRYLARGEHLHCWGKAGLIPLSDGSAAVVREVNVCVCVCVWVCVCGCGWLQDLLEKCDQEFRSDDGVKQSKSVKYSNIFIRS
jgi:hypothetical protein